MTVPPGGQPPESATRSGPRVRPDPAELDRVFGDVLPSTTRDERDEDPRDLGSADRDDWYRDNRPPHHRD